MVINYQSIPIHFTEHGRGKPLVLLHGFMEELSMWEPFIPQLQEKCRVISIDLPGHGKSGIVKNTHTMETMADVVLKVLDVLGIVKSSIIGHSMGGYVALALADLNPDIITDLVLLNSTFLADTEERKILRTRAIEQAHQDYEKLIRLSFSNLFAPESRKVYSNEYNNALKKALQTPIEGFIAASEGMKLRPNRLEVLKKINGRKVIIGGTKDTLIDLNKLREIIKNSSIELLEFSEGHMSHIENKSDLSYFFKRLIEK